VSAGARLRRGVPGDAALLEAIAGEAFAGYRSFAPEGWEPPARGSDIIATIGERLADPTMWCRLAELEGDPAGHVGFLASERTARPDPAPDLAHLWHLFVRPPYWGSGLATRLHALAVEEAARQGYTVMRLHTPSGQARARRFYEREGWWATATHAADPVLGLETVEYRRCLP
jgi:GNAT superfamily N-acetyltransferase